MKLDFESLDHKWLALQVRSGWELRTALGLKERGYEEFVPVYQQKRLWADRARIVHAPLFPGYVFLRFNACNRQAIISVPGVLRFVGAGNRPLPISDVEIDALRLTTNAAVTCGPCAFLEVGQTVQVCNGPLQGLAGRIENFKNRQRLVLSVSLLRRSMYVEIDGYDVVALNSAPVAHDYHLGSHALALAS